VSKWERGDGYPEITLLPALAARFGVAIDALLGTEKELTHEQMFELIRKASELEGNGKRDEARALVRDAITTFPKMLSLRGFLATANYAEYMNAEYRGENPSLDLLSTALEEYEYIIKYTDDDITRWSAENNALPIYYKLGYGEKVNALLSKPTYDHRNSAVDCRSPDFAVGNDRVFRAQTAIFGLAQLILYMTMRLTEVEYKRGAAILHPKYPGEGDWILTRQERILALEKAVAVLDIVYGKDYDGFFLRTVWGAFDIIERIAFDDGDIEKVIESLQRQAELAIRIDAADTSAAEKYNAACNEAARTWNEKGLAAPPEFAMTAYNTLDDETKAKLHVPQSSSVLINHLTPFTQRVSSSKSGFTSCEEMLQSLAEPKYDALRADPRFTALVSLLEQNGNQ